MDTVKRTKKKCSNWEYYSKNVNSIFGVT